jgi:alpha-amylase
MFDPADATKNLMNTDCTIYMEISKIAAVQRASAPLRFGRMYFRQISDGRGFGFPYGFNYILAFSRILFGREMLVAYNVSEKPQTFSIIVDADIQKGRQSMTYLYGSTGTVAIQKPTDPNDPTRFVQLSLDPHQFVILE